MELLIATAALILAIVACVVSVLIYLHREDTHALAAKQRSIELEFADVVDRLSVWQRRDASRARKVDGSADAEQRGLFPDQHATAGNSRAQLRAVARARGLMP